MKPPRSTSLFAVIAALTLTLVLSGCGKSQPGQVVLGFVTDLESVPYLEVQLFTGTEASSVSDEIIAAPELPGTYVLRSEEPSSVLVKAIVLDRANKPIVYRAAALSIVPGEARFLRLALEARCPPDACDGATTCIDGECLSPLDSRDMPAFTSSQTTTLDCPAPPDQPFFRSTTTGRAMKVQGQGTCPAGQVCSEGSCRIAR